MKTPCEIVVWYVLPTIRRELAKELVDTYGMKQSQVAKIFGVTDAAVSQYLKNKRGSSEIIEGSVHWKTFETEVKSSAKLISSSSSDLSSEMCRICTAIKDMGLLAEIYAENTGSPAPKCAWGESRVQLT